MRLGERDAREERYNVIDLLQEVLISQITQGPNPIKHNQLAQFLIGTEI